MRFHRNKQHFHYVVVYHVVCKFNCVVWNAWVSAWLSPACCSLLLLVRNGTERALLVSEQGFYYTSWPRSATSNRTIINTNSVTRAQLVYAVSVQGK